MNESEKDIILKRLWKAQEMLIISNECFKIVKYLFENNYSSNQFFTWTLIVNFRLMIIELNKLLVDSKSQHFNIEGLFRYIEGLGADSNMLKIQITIYRAELLLHNPIIVNLKQQRDKIYAHTDSNSDRVERSFDAESIGRLIHLTHTMINGIMSEIGEEGYNLDQNEPPVNGMVELLKIQMAINNKDI